MSTVTGAPPLDVDLQPGKPPILQAQSSGDTATWAAEHREALRLAWESLHVPVGTLLLGALLGMSVLSAVSTMWAL